MEIILLVSRQVGLVKSIVFCAKIQSANLTEVGIEDRAKAGRVGVAAISCFLYSQWWRILKAVLSPFNKG
jgi:hypothetical protein